MATRQRVFLATTRVLPERLDDLRRRLRSVDALTDGNPFARLRTTHFLRWVILEERHNPLAAQPDAKGREAGEGKLFGPVLLLTTIFDGSRRKHLAELGTVLEAELRKIYETCFPGADGWSGRRITQAVKRGSTRPHLFFNGTHLRTLDQIDLERTGWSWIQEELDVPRRGADEDPLTWIRRRMGAEDAPPWMGTWRRRPALPIRPHPFLEGVGVLAVLTALAAVVCYGDAGSILQSTRLGLSALLTGLALLFVFAGVAHAALFRWVARAERREIQEEIPAPPFLPDNSEDGSPWESEVGEQLNEVTHLALIKPGIWRLVTLRVVLFWLNLATRLVAARLMHLGRITTIHFAYWAIIGKPRRLLFVSHYDGTFENYLHDFALLDTHYGVNAIWSNCAGFPQTRDVFRGGARERIRRFTDFGRAFQHTAQVWFRAYRDLPAAHINRNTLVREGLIARIRWIGFRRWDSPTRDWATLRRMT